MSSEKITAGKIAVLDLMYEKGLVRLLEKDKNTGADSAYINFVTASGYGNIINICIDVIKDKIIKKGYKQIIGVEERTWPYVTLVGIKSGLPYAIIGSQKFPRTYHESDILGNCSTKNNFLLLDFNRTNLRMGIEALRSLNYKPKDVLVLLDDEIGRFYDRKISIDSLFKEKEVIKYLKDKRK